MAGLVPQVATVGAHAAADGGSPPVRASGVLLPAGPVRTRRVMPNRCVQGRICSLLGRAHRIVDYLLLAGLV